MFRKILLAYDGSEGSQYALEKILELVTLCKAEFFILSVGRIPEYAETVSEVEEAKEQANKYYEKILSQAVRKSESVNIKPNTIIRYGKPGDIIVDVAKEIKADLIVLGSKRPLPLKKRILGATADKVVDHAHCSVLILR